MNSEDKPLFLDIDDAHNAINSNILKQTMLSQESRGQRDNEAAILSASNGKHENGDADYDYSDLGPETDVDAIDDVPPLPVRNLSYEFYKDDPAHDENQPDRPSNVLDNANADDAGNANVEAIAMNQPIRDSNLDEDEDDDDDEDEDDDDDEHDDVHRDNDVPIQAVRDDVSEEVREVIREEMDNRIREQLEEDANDEKGAETRDNEVCKDDDAENVIDKPCPVDYDDSLPSPQANKPLQHALIPEADNVADSEDSEDEWNYYRVDPNKEKDSTTPVNEPQETKNEEENKIPVLSFEDTESKILSEGVEEDIKCINSEEESSELINTEISAKDGKVDLEEKEDPCAEEQEKPKDMDFQLNPNAAEFIPVSPQFMESRMNLVEDYPVSGSPFKQVPQMDDIQVPSQSEFDKEVCLRPREVDTEEKEQQNGDALQRTDSADFISDRQKTNGPGNMDDSEISSTKAEFGDESAASFLTTSELQRTNIFAADESFSSSERDYDIAKDLMPISLTPSDFEAVLYKPVDLNAVHYLSNTDLEDKNGTVDKEEDDIMAEFSELQPDSSNLVSSSDIEDLVDKSAPPKETEEPVNLLFSQQYDSESTAIKQAEESKLNAVNLLNLQSESSQMKEQETAKYDHSPLTENYSTEFESEKEPVSVDNEQPLSPSSADIDETKPLDETSEDAILPENDFQKETCSNEANTPSSLSPVPDALESDLMAPVESKEVESSSLHADAPEFLPGQLSFQSYDMEINEIKQLSTKPVDVCQISSIKVTDSYQPYSTATGDAFELIKQDLAANEKFDKEEIDELVCTKPAPVPEENLLDFTGEQNICTKPLQIQSELTPPLSPQQIHEKPVESVIYDVESSISEHKHAEVAESKELPEKTNIIEDKANETTEVMEEQPVKSAEPVELEELGKSIEQVEAAKPIEQIVESVIPIKQMEPVIADEPMEPAIADEPMEPAIADEPMEPAIPEEPMKPAISEEPLEPAIADEPIEAAIPDEPMKPTVPGEPMEPAIPGEPMEPAKLIESVEVVQPMEPVEEPSLNLSDSMQEFTGLESQLQPKEEEEEERGFAPCVVENVQEKVVKEEELKEVTEPEKSMKYVFEEECKIQQKEEVQEMPEVKEPEDKKPEIAQLEVKEPDLKELEIKETETKELEIKEAETKELEIKEAETKESEIKEAEIKKPEIKEPEVEEKTAEKVSGSKAVEAAAAVAATTAVVAGAVAAQSKAKSKTTSAKPTKTATSKTTAPKSTPTSPSKATTPTARTSTTAAKKMSATTPTRPKDLDAPRKSILASTTSKPSVSKTTSKTTASTTSMKPATKTNLGVASKAKPATTVSSPKLSVVDKKPTANGEVKPLSKPAAAKPPSKTTSATKTMLVKTSTTRTSIGATSTTTMSKSRPASATTATRTVTTAKSNTITSTTASSTRPKTTSSIGSTTTKSRMSKSKSPMIDKQVKETANKQISMARTSSSSATSKTTRLSNTTNSSSTTTTMRRAFSTTKTTTSTAASPTKKPTAITKVSKTSSTGGKVTTEKGKVPLQNGVSENVDINTIIDDVPKKDLSPVVAPNDNQLIMSSD